MTVGLPVSLEVSATVTLTGLLSADLGAPELDPVTLSLFLSLDRWLDEEEDLMIPYEPSQCLRAFLSSSVTGPSTTITLGETPDLLLGSR